MNLSSRINGAGPGDELQLLAQSGIEVAVYGGQQFGTVSMLTEITNTILNLSRGLGASRAFEDAMSHLVLLLLLIAAGSSGKQTAQEGEAHLLMTPCELYARLNRNERPSLIRLKGELIMTSHGRLLLDSECKTKVTFLGQTHDPWLPIGAADKLSAASEILEALHLIYRTLRIEAEVDGELSIKEEFKKQEDATIVHGNGFGYRGLFPIEIKVRTFRWIRLTTIESSRKD